MIRLAACTRKEFFHFSIWNILVIMCPLFCFCCMGWSFVQPPSQWIAGEDWERPYRSLHLHLKPLFVSGASTKANRTGVSTEADLMSQWRAVKRREAQCHQMTQWDPGEAEGWIWPGWREHLGDALIYMAILFKWLCLVFLQFAHQPPYWH